MTPLIRHAAEAYIVYVRHAWSKDSHAKLKASLHWSRQGVAPLYTLYDQLFRPVQERIAKRADCFVAANPDDHDQILGYLLCERGATPVVYYVQVKSDFQRQGVARALLAHAAISKTAPAVYAFGCALTDKEHRSIIPKIWTHVPWYLMPEVNKAAK